MHILGSGETGIFLQSGLFHCVITLDQDGGSSASENAQEGGSSISFLYGKYEARGKCPSPFQGGGEETTLKALVFGDSD